MISFDPDQIIVQDAGTDIISLKDGKRLGDFIPGKEDWEIQQKWGMKVPEQGGTAYIRIPPALRDFLKLCHETSGVIGFEYDFNEMGLNFGVVLKKGKK